MLKGFIDAMGYLFCAILMGGMIGFIGLNMFVGCNDWTDPACITPSEFVGFFIP